MAVDWLDPCARAAALREAYFRLISGDAEKVIRYKGPQGEREVQLTAADLKSLQQELAKAETECKGLTDPTSSSRRYAIRGGAMRRFCS
jgi:hypothetical protein